MIRCRHCGMHGLEVLDERIVCVFCGVVLRDNATALERTLSNTTPEAVTHSGLREPGEIAAALDRAMGWGR